MQNIFFAYSNTISQLMRTTQLLNRYSLERLLLQNFNEFEYTSSESVSVYICGNFFYCISMCTLSLIFHNFFSATFANFFFAQNVCVGNKCLIFFNLIKCFQRLYRWCHTKIDDDEGANKKLFSIFFHFFKPKHEQIDPSLMRQAPYR